MFYPIWNEIWQLEDPIILVQLQMSCFSHVPNKKQHSRRFVHGDANPVKRLLTLIRSEVQQPPFPARKHWLPCGNNTSLYAHMYMYVYTYIYIYMCVCVKLINVHICWITYMNVMHMFKYMYICIHFELYCGMIWYYFIFILLYYYTT